MNAWIRQKHNQYIDSWRIARIIYGKERVTLICPDTDNVLVDCSKEFLVKEIDQGRIIVGKEKRPGSRS